MKNMKNYWFDKIIAFKKTCEAGNTMTETQARILRAALYDYEILHKPLQDNPQTDNTIKREIINKDDDSITIDRNAAQAIIDLLTNKLK